MQQMWYISPHLENAQHGARKCHKCGNKNHFSTCCRSKQSGDGNRRSQNRSKGHKGKGNPSRSRSRSKSMTKSAHCIKSDSFQDHWDDIHGDDSDNLHRESADPHGGQQETSMEPTPFKTIRKVLILSRKPLLPFTGQNLWPAYAMIQTQRAKPTSSRYCRSSCHTKMA